MQLNSAKIFTFISFSFQKYWNIFYIFSDNWKTDIQLNVYLLMGFNKWFCFVVEFRVLMFVILLPWMQIILFCLSVGKDPKGLHLAVVNNDLNNTMDSCPVRGVGCDQSALSCQYLDYLKNKSIILVCILYIFF